MNLPRMVAKTALCLCICAGVSSSTALAGGAENCNPADSLGQQILAPIGFEAFTSTRVGRFGLDISARDIEFHWDGIYPGGLSAGVAGALRRFAKTLSGIDHVSPVARDATNLQAVYDYTHREPYGLTWNSTNPADSIAFRVGYSGDTPPDGGNNLDRSHVDTYIFHPSRQFGTVDGGSIDGSHPSAVTTAAEDEDTGHPQGKVFETNSTMIRGPGSSSATDTTESGWAGPRSIQRLRFNHELQHALPPREFGGAIGEFYSAVAEAVGGIDDTTASAEVPYTWPLLSRGVGNSETVVRAAGNNYQARTAFAAYLAYNFIGADTSKTLAGMTDDLLYKWMKLSDGENARTMRSLVGLLGDTDCGTCATKSYLHTATGASLSTRERMMLIHHNWRVANFVNNPALAEGQFGYPGFAGFSPARHQRAWRAVDPFGTDDIIALPAIRTLSARELTREISLQGDRSVRGNTYPMTLVPFAANYWVFRADASLLGSSRDLVIRITPRRCFRCVTATGLKTADARIMASAVAYNISDQADTVETSLWRSPAAAVFTTTVQSVVVDSVSGALEIVVPSFGATHRAVLLTLTSADGNLDRMLNLADTQPYVEAVPYRLDIGMRVAPFASNEPVVMTFNPSDNEASPAWSPTGEFVAFQRTSGGLSQIYTRRLDMGAAVQPPMALLAPQPIHQHDPDWSLRNEIAFSADSSSTESSIWLASTSGAPLRQLTALTGRETMPAFSPDAQCIAYVHTPSGATSSQVRCISRTGSGDYLVAQLLGDASSRRPRWSPDGSRLFISMPGDSDYVYSVPRFGGTIARDGGISFRGTNFDLPIATGKLVVATPLPITNHARQTAVTFYSCGASPISLPASRLAFLGTSPASRDTAFRFVNPRTTFDHPRISPDGTRVLYQAEDAITHDKSIMAAPNSWNHAPRFAGLQDVSIPACIPFQMFFTTSDVDGEAVTVQAAQLPSGVQFVGGNTLRIQNPHVGEFYAVMRAFDSSGGVDNRVIRISVYDDGDCGDPLVDGEPGCPGCFSGRQSGANVAHHSSDTDAASTSYLNGSLPGEWFSETARLGRLAEQTDHSASIILRATLPGHLAIDRARLWTADVDSALHSLVVGGTVVGAEFRPVLEAASSSGADVLAALDSVRAAGGSLMVDGDEMWTVELAPTDSASGLVIECARQGGSLWGTESGIEVQTAHEDGWRTSDWILPRRGGDLLGGLASGSTRLRLIFHGPAEVRGAQSFRIREEGSSITAAAPTGAAVAEALPALLSTDSLSLVLARSETTSMTFPVPPHAQGRGRSYFLELRAAYTPPTGAWAASARSAGISPAMRTSLLPSRPNPFSDETLLRFELSTAARVSIEVYDAQGRMVRLLTDHSYSPGAHSVIWSGDDDQGRRASPGVYWVRMTADRFVARRRLVLLRN